MPIIYNSCLKIYGKIISVPFWTHVINFVSHQEEVGGVKCEFSEKAEGDDPDACVFDFLELLEHGGGVPRVEAVGDEQHHVVHIVAHVNVVERRLDARRDVRETPLPCWTEHINTVEHMGLRNNNCKFEIFQIKSKKAIL